MTLDRQEVHEIVNRVFARQDVIEACRRRDRRDIGLIISVLGSHGISQGLMAGLTGIPQGRLSEYKTGKRLPTLDTLEDFANGLGVPEHARRALGLAAAADDDAALAAANALTEQAAMPDILTVAWMAGSLNNHVDRRAVVQLAATLVAAPLLGVEEPMERLAYALIGPTRLQEDTITFLEQRTVGLHRIEPMFQARLIHRAIMSHLREVTALLEGHPQDPLRSRLARVAGESAVLAAWTAWDLGEGAHSARMYRITEAAARAAEDPVIMACANTYRSYATSGPAAHEDARRLLAEARACLPEDGENATRAAAELCGMTWVNRLERGQARAAALRRSFPHLTNLARIVRDVDGYTEVDFDLLCVTAEWFRQHSAAGLTPRQVPIPGLHAKWLNTRHATVATLAGLPALDLLPRHPARLHFTYLDPRHRAAGRRWHDSATVGDPMMPAYLPSVVVISENKDTALHFLALDAGISVEGMGHGGATAASVPWLRECPNLFYWGDIDASGLEILDGFRAAGVPVTSVLMDLATYERYEQFGSSTDARGNPLTATACRPLAHLTAAEQQLYECLTDPTWTRYRRVEQERIPLSVAAEAVQAQLTAHSARTT